jgi:hypothetical protein
MPAQFAYAEAGSFGYGSTRTVNFDGSSRERYTRCVAFWKSPSSAL